MESIIKESTNLFYETDGCITKLLKARLDKDSDKEGEAIFKMESLMIETMQHLSWLVGELKRSSQIHWKTGEPKETGNYIVALKDGSIDVSMWLNVGKCWVVLNDSVLAWCKLTDIGPYKEVGLCEELLK